MQFPNINCYSLACLLRHACGQLSDSFRYSKMALEQAAAQPWSLTAFLHTDICKLPQQLKNSLIYRDTVIAWREVRRKLELSPRLFNFTLISHNPMFPQGSHHEPFNEWALKGLIQFAQLFKSQSCLPKTLSELREELYIAASHFIHYYQITTFQRTQNKDPSYFLSHLFLDQLVSTSAYQVSDVHSRLDILCNKTMTEGPPSKWCLDYHIENINNDLL